MANFEYSIARRANFTNAFLANAKLSQVDFSESQFERAFMEDADLTGSSFDNADLSRAILRGVNATNADFSKANLTKAFLIETDFSKALNLTQAQLDSALGHKETTKIPPNLAYPEHWSAE